MIELHKLCWIITFALYNNVDSVCVITKRGAKVEERYTDCSRGYCQQLKRIIETGPIEYLCSYTGLTEMNQYSQQNSRIENKLIVNNSDIPTLSANMYLWINLTEFRMSHTNTSQIIPGFFSKFDSLTILEITNNKIQTLIDGVFSSLSVLTSLNLSCNSITSLSAHIFSGLLHLKIVDLSKNKITFISPKVFDNQNFLTYVDISQNLITDIADIFNKTSLQTIKLFKNRLNEFNFEQLQHNSELAEVDLSQNKIKIVKNIGNIKNLNVSYNYLVTTNATTLNLRITSLDLNYNNISVIYETNFENTTNLEYLYLGHNKIKSLPRESLKELKFLIHLDLSFNRIQQIPFGLFNNLNRLAYLDLSNNNMALDFYTLTTLKSLNVLKIRNNQITNFDANLLITRFKKVSFLSLGNNMWNCSELANTIHLLQINNVTISPENNTKTNNILGIACKDNVDFKEQLIGNNKAVLQKNDKDTELFAKRAYYADNYQNTTFYKMLETISQQLVKQNVSISPDNTIQNSFVQYLNQNFNNTNFYKYMEDLKSFENKSTSSFSQMMNFFGKGFNQTNFYKYFNSLQSPQINNASRTISAPVIMPSLNETVKLLSSINKTLFNISENFKATFVSIRENNLQRVPENNNIPKSVNAANSKVELLNQNQNQQALVDGHFTDYTRSFRDNLIFTNVLLVLMLCTIMVHLYYTFWKPKRIVTSTQEQVQLM